MSMFYLKKKEFMAAKIRRDKGLNEFLYFYHLMELKNAIFSHHIRFPYMNLFQACIKKSGYKG